MVELLVSLGILAIVLSATAASLIGFARTALENERRVQTTAQLGGLHEQYQAVPWLWAGVYLDEVEDLADRIVSGEVEDVDGLEFDATTDTWTLDGDDLFVLPGPCPDGSSLPFDDCRVDFVPRAYEELEVDDRDYEVIQLVTERSVRAPDDPDAVDEPDLRRVTTIVRWEVRGRPFEQVFVSERAPTAREQADVTGRPIRQFIVTPRPIQARLVADPDLERVQNDEEVRIAARFDRGLFQADVCFLDAAAYLDAGSDTFDPVTFDPDSECAATRRFEMDPVLLEDGSLHSGFRLDLGAGAVRFTDTTFIDDFTAGFRDIKVVLVGYLGGGDYLVTDATVQFLDDNVDLDDGPTAESFELGTGVPFFEPGVVDITGELCDDFEIRVNATGVTDGGEVRLYYATDRSQGLASVPGFPWRTEFLAGAVSPWAPRPGSPVRDILYATVTNEITVGDGTVTRTSRLIGSSDAEFRFSLESNGGCPPS